MGSSTRTTQGGESIDSELISYTFHTRQNLASWARVKVVEIIRLFLQRVCKVVASRIRNSSLSGSYIQVVLLKTTKSLCIFIMTTKDPRSRREWLLGLQGKHASNGPCQCEDPS